ncbi:MAG TPA: HIT family protein [Candidatus Uhrbacteria bacterium]|nr:HIT family protein [Candidatus Uhrbacteria bacterium]
MPNGECLFCQIVAGEAPSTMVAESDNVLAILDVHPVNPGHVLIIPKKHSANMLDADDEILKEMILLTKRVAKAVLDAFEEYDAFNLELNNGRIAGQVIPHLHWHIVPRKADDGLQHWPGRKYPGGEAEKVAEKIRAAIK